MFADVVVGAGDGPGEGTGDGIGTETGTGEGTGDGVAEHVLGRPLHLLLSPSTRALKAVCQLTS